MAKESRNIEWILQDSLEALLTGEAELDALLARYPEHREELQPRLEAVLWLDERKAALDPPPGFVENSSERLLARLEANGFQNVAVQETDSRPLGWIGAWLAALRQSLTRRNAFQFAMTMIVVFSLLFGFYGAARASQSALPGEPLYGLKIGLERVELTLAFSEVKRAELHIRFAQRRLFEIQQLIQEDRYERVAQAVADFEEQMSKANQSLELAAQQDPARAKELLVAMQETLTRQQAVFTAMTETVPPQVRPDIDRLLAATDVGLAQTQELLDGIGDLIGPGLTVTPVVTQDVITTPSPSKEPTATEPSSHLFPTPLITKTTPVVTEPVADSTPEPPIIERLDETEDTSVDEGEDGGEDPADDDDTNKADKKKPKPTKKDLPDPPNRPIDPPGQEKKDKDK